jgi:hypothetical protein
VFAHRWRWPLVLALLGAVRCGHATAQDLTQGKTPTQLFAGDCAACHKSPQGLAKDNDPRALASFLRQHYTTKPEMAEALAAYVIGSGGVARGSTPDHPGQQPGGRPRTASTGDAPRASEGDGPRQRLKPRPAGSADEESNPPEQNPIESSKPATKPRASVAVAVGDKSAGGDASEEPRTKRKPNARAEESKKPADVVVPTGKLNSYARSGSSEKDEAAESEAKLREYATAGEAAPTVASVALKPTIGNSPSEPPGTKESSREESPSDESKASPDDTAKTGERATTDSGAPKSSGDDQTKPTKPRKPTAATDAKQRADAAAVPLSPTAFFGRLFSGNAKPTQ